MAHCLYSYRQGSIGSGREVSQESPRVPRLNLVRRALSRLRGNKAISEPLVFSFPTDGETEQRGPKAETFMSVTFSLVYGALDGI